MTLITISDSTSLSTNSESALYFLKEVIYAIGSVISFVIFVYLFIKAKQNQNADEPVPAYSGGGGGETFGFMIKSQGQAPRPQKGPNSLLRPPFIYIFLLCSLIFLALFVVGVAQNPIPTH